jgi:hypothetical protein
LYLPYKIVSVEKPMRIAKARGRAHTDTIETLLLFELFPLFMTIVCALVAVGLYVSNRRARNDPPDPVVTVTPPAPSDKTERTSGGRRPSMSA